MKSSLHAIALTAALTLSATIASAGSYTLTHDYTSLLGGHPSNAGVVTSGSPKFLDTNPWTSAPSFFENTFNLASTAFNAATETIVSATATFKFADDGGRNDGTERAIVRLDGSYFTSVSNPALWWVVSPNYTTVGGSLGALLGALTSDGQLTYRVEATRGDIYFKWAQLTITTEARQVPDGGTTLALLALGLVSLAAARLRKCCRWRSIRRLSVARSSLLSAVAHGWIR